MSQEEIVDNKIQKLIKLSTYIDKDEDNVYRFLHNKIKLPNNFDTITWHIIFDETITGLDSMATQSRIFTKMLDSLVIYNKSEHPLLVNDFIEHFGSPTEVSTKNGDIEKLHYWFRSSKKECIEEPFEIDFQLDKCSSLLSMKFNSKKELVKIYSHSFWP